MTVSTASPTTVELLFRRMLEIRAFEESLLEAYKSGAMTGTTHTCIGQESVAVAALAHLRPADLVVSNHRSHGHFIAAGGDPRALFLEILGDRRGVCEGLGGSQHLHRENFYSNGVLGGTVAVATGLALDQKLADGGGVVVCFLGDGAFGEGAVYESFNIASLWRLPILFIVENNGYAQTTPLALNLAGSLTARPMAFGIDTADADATDVTALHTAFAHAFQRVRGGAGPFCQVVRCYRFSPHSKGDDFRDPSEIAAWRARDSLEMTRAAIPVATASLIEDDVRRQTEAVFAAPAAVETLPPDRLDTDEQLLPEVFEPRDGLRSSGTRPTMVSHLRETFDALMAERADMYLLGEDIFDPYGGAFKVYAGLSTRYPERVLTTPISESAIVGVAAGLALRGRRPVVEIMFGDFLALTADQLLNYVTKFSRMYRSAACPVIIRTPMGGRRGYGPTHSQSIEKHFFGIPGLLVVAADPLHDQRFIWNRMIDSGRPALYVENKVLYGTALPEIDGDRVLGMRATSTRSFLPTARLSLAPDGEPVDGAIVAYGGMVLPAIEAAHALFETHELIVDVVVPSQLAPLPVADLARCTAGARAIAVVEEGTRRWGFGAEVIAALAERRTDARLLRVAMPDTIIPNSAALERQILPAPSDIVRALAAALL